MRFSAETLLSFSEKTVWQTALIVLGGLSVAGAAFAQAVNAAPPYFREKEEGWFWKKSPPEPVKPKPPLKTALPPPAPVKPSETDKLPPAPFSVVWLREQMPRLLEKAIDDPTPDNIAAYMYVQRVMLDKSQVFAESAKAVVLSDPLLDEANRIPLASFGKAAFMRVTDEAKTAVLKDLATKGGIWFFYQSSCQFCEPMSDMVATLEMRYGFITYAISMDGKPIAHQKNWVQDKGQAQQMQVKLTPTVIYVVPPNNYYVVAQGLMSSTDLEERILVAAETSKMLSPEQLAMLYPERNQLLMPDVLKDGANPDDPVALVKNIRQKILGAGASMPTAAPIKPAPIPQTQR